MGNTGISYTNGTLTVDPLGTSAETDPIMVVNAAGENVYNGSIYTYGQIWP